MYIIITMDKDRVLCTLHLCVKCHKTLVISNIHWYALHSPWEPYYISNKYHLSSLFVKIYRQQLCTLLVNKFTTASQSPHKQDNTSQLEHVLSTNIIVIHVCMYEKNPKQKLLQYKLSVSLNDKCRIKKSTFSCFVVYFQNIVVYCQNIHLCV